jgi:hypothetical protein
MAEQDASVTGMSPAELAAWVAESRAAQGLPSKITDPAMLDRLVTLAFAGLDDLNTTTPRGCRTPRRRADHSAAQREGPDDPTG